MIKRINKIKNLGLVFSNYIRDNNLPDFKKYNLIYGWNGCGKTTLTKLFDALEEGKSEEYPKIEYEIENDSGRKFKESETFDKKVRVFNQDYIENNLEIREGKAKTITLTLGKANKKIIKQIEKDELLLKTKNDELKNREKNLKNLVKNKDNLFREIAKSIYIAIVGGAIRTYVKTNAEDDFSQLKDKSLLDKRSLNELAIIVKQKSEDKISPLKDLEFDNQTGKKISLSQFSGEITIKAKQLLLKTVAKQIIERLKRNTDISQWVEEGIKIHNNHDSDRCEFCRQRIPFSRLDELTKYFNENDKILKNEIDNLALKFDSLYQVINNEVFPVKSQLYDELRSDYEISLNKLILAKKSLLSDILELKKTVLDKKDKTTEPMVTKQALFVKDFISARKDCISLIERHNKKTEVFEDEKTDAILKLKKHYLSTIFDDVNTISKNIKNETDLIEILNNGNSAKPGDVGINNLNKRIKENQFKISSTTKACKEISDGLSIFLGREELEFEPNKITIAELDGSLREVDDGYIIKRNGQLATNLSEGEKTAIAFIYFTTQLKDQNFDIKDGVVVIDDPVSSLDSNSIFQAFAFLKNAVIDAHQVFVFTHNFDFLKLLLNWSKNVDHGTKSAYFMIKNDCSIKGCRKAIIDEMDKELWKYESEYHYLFKQLKEFKSDQTIIQSYPIPNIARKVLETFLMFRVPNGDTPYAKLVFLQNSTVFDKRKYTSIYKFLNDQSHITGSGFDPALVPETQKNVKYLLEMIENVFPEHYKILNDSTN